MIRDTVSKYSFLFFLATAVFAVFYFSRPLPPSGKTVVRFLTYEIGQEQMNLVRKIETEFERLNPDIEVQVEFNSRAQNQIYVEFASGTGPDTFYAVGTDIPRLASKNAIEPLTNWFAKDPTADPSIFFEQAVDVLRYPPPGPKHPREQTGIFSYPVHFSTDVLFYNEDLFLKAGMPFPDDSWTWARFTDAARRLTNTRGKQKVFGMFLPDPTMTIWSNGGSTFNADYTRSVVYSPEAVEAIEELRRLRWVDRVAPSPAQIQESNSMQMFKLGQLAMLPGRTYMTVDLNKVEDFRYNVCMMPGMKKKASRLAVGGICMSTQSKNKEASWRWMKFYCSPEGGGRILGELKNCVTAIREYAYSPDYFMKPPPKNNRPMVDSLYHSLPVLPPVVGAPEYSLRISVPMFDEMLRLEKADVPAMLKQMQDETNLLLEKEPPITSVRTTPNTADRR